MAASVLFLPHARTRGRGRLFLPTPTLSRSGPPPLPPRYRQRPTAAALLPLRGRLLSFPCAAAAANGGGRRPAPLLPPCAAATANGGALLRAPRRQRPTAAGLLPPSSLSVCGRAVARLATRLSASSARRAQMATSMRSASLLRLGFRHVSSLLFQGFLSPSPRLGLGRAVMVRLRCLAAEAGGDRGKKVPARLALTQQVLRDAEERAASAGSDPAPKITLNHVTVNFARSGGPGGQNVNKVNTKVDMRFNVKEAHWLGERIKERILQTEKNRINKDGELVISSTKTRTQKGNIEDALEKIQAIIDAASYVPPPPSDEQKKKIEKIAAEAERKRLQKKKALSHKKEFRRNRTTWD